MASQQVIRTSSHSSDYEFCMDVIERKKKIDSSFWDLAERLYVVKSAELFRAGWVTWEDYCDEFQGLSIRSMDKLIQIYRTFVIEHGIPIAELEKTTGWAALAETLPAVHTPEDAKMWIGRAQVLSLRDLRKEVKEERTGVVMSQCSHPHAYTIKVCPDCGDREKIFACPHCNLPIEAPKILPPKL